MKADRKWWLDGQYDRETLKACPRCGRPKNCLVRRRCAPEHGIPISLTRQAAVLNNGKLFVDSDPVACQRCGCQAPSRSALVRGRYWHECPPGWIVSESVDGDDGPLFCCSLECLIEIQRQEEGDEHVA